VYTLLADRPKKARGTSTATDWGHLEAADISRYQQRRLAEKAAAKTVNLEVGTLRAILRKTRLWANVQPNVNMLSAREDVGRAISGTISSGPFCHFH
jgi:hypothetical protein